MGKAIATGQFGVHFKANRCRVNSFLFFGRVMQFDVWKVSIESFFFTHAENFTSLVF